MAQDVFGGLWNECMPDGLNSRAGTPHLALGHTEADLANGGELAVELAEAGGLNHGGAAAGQHNWFSIRTRGRATQGVQWLPC
jgi:hypothetical protein